MTSVLSWVGSPGEVSGRPQNSPLQEPTPPPVNPTTQIQTLLAAQQSALLTNDPAQILAASTPAAALALRLAATLDLAADNLPAACDLLTRSFALDPQIPTGLLLLTTDTRANHPAEAQTLAAQLLHITGDTAPAHLLLAQTFQAADDLPSTIRDLTRALALAPQLPSVHLALGTAFWQLNEYQYNPDSLREFTLAQQADPTAFLPNLDLASLLSQYHRFPEAARYLALAAAADPTSPDPPFQLGMNLYAQAADPQIADPPIGNAQAADHQAPYPQTGNAQANYAAARPPLEQAVQLTATNLSHNNFQIRRALVALSRIAALEHHPDLAQTLATQADDLHQQLLASGQAPTLTESTGLLIGAGASHATKQPHATPNPDNQKTMSSRLERSAVEGPASPSTTTNPLHQQLLTLAASTLNDAGTALARTHDYAAALPLFRQAAAIDPTLPPVLRNLGLAAFHTAAYPEAATALTQALQRDPTDTLARRYLDQIPLQTTPSPPHP